MRITELKLTNFRCFEDFKIQFAENHNVHVIVAGNMVGKSAIMRALRIAANTYTNGIITLQGYGIERMDHRVIGHNVINDISLNSSVEVAAVIYDEENKPHKAHWLKFKEKPFQDDKKDRTKTLFSDDLNITTIAKKVYEQTIIQKSHLPLINFIGTEYIHVLLSKTDNFSLNGDAIQGYKDCLNDKSIQKFLFDWLKRIDGIMGEKARKKIVADAYGSLPDDAWFVFQEAVKSLLPDIRGFEWLADKKQPIVEFTNGDIRLFDMLSDGYRYLILLAGDLATRAIILNKHLGQNALKETTGLVIIDEFGIHLHPSLQSETLERLQATFPKIQFILSTHSPLLLNGLKKEQVHILEMDETGKRTVRYPDEDVIGMGAEGILRDLFGLYSTFDKTSLKMNEAYKGLLKKKTDGILSDDERTEFAKLSEQLSHNRLDPTLEIVQDDTITKLVREKLEQRSQNTEQRDKSIPNDLPKQVESILDNFFKTAS
jgi:predicted ATP-binding protein involved in virulence